MTKPTVTSVHLDVFLGYATLTASLSDGSSTKLFSYYIDEISFSLDELVGLTVEQACDLYRSRDIAYLRS